METLFFLLGFAALITSIVAASAVLAFIGLGLVFWGAILMNVGSGRYVKESLLNVTTTSALLTLNEALDALGYAGKPVYLPPKYLNNAEESKVYIPKLETSKLPTPEETQELENQSPSRDSRGLLMTPPGAKLAELFEKTMGTSFTRTDLNHLQQYMPKLVTEDLEMAANLEITVETAKTNAPTESIDAHAPAESDRIHVAITDSIYKATYQEIEQTANINGNLGCPLTSAIACAIAKATGKPTIIENEKTSMDGQTKEAEYQTYEEE